MEESAKIMVAAAVCARKDAVCLKTSHVVLSHIYDRVEYKHTLYSVTYTTALNISVSRTSNYLKMKLDKVISS